MDVSNELAIEAIRRQERIARLRSSVVFCLSVPTAFVVLLSFLAVLGGLGGAVSLAWFCGGAVAAIGLGVNETRRNKARAQLALASASLAKGSGTAALEGNVLAVRADQQQWRFPLSRRSVRAITAPPEARLLRDSTTR